MDDRYLIEGNGPGKTASNDKLSENEDALMKNLLSEFRELYEEKLRQLDDVDKLGEDTTKVSQ